MKGPESGPSLVPRTHVDARIVPLPGPFPKPLEATPVDCPTLAGSYQAPPHLVEVCGAETLSGSSLAASKGSEPFEFV